MNGGHWPSVREQREQARSKLRRRLEELVEQRDAYLWWVDQLETFLVEHDRGQGRARELARRDLVGRLHQARRAAEVEISDTEARLLALGDTIAAAVSPTDRPAS